MMRPSKKLVDGTAYGFMVFIAVELRVMKTIKMPVRSCRWTGLVAGIWLSASVSLFSAEPRLECEMPTFDFGSTLDTQIIRHTFMLHNTGDDAATILRVNGTCGCITSLPTRSAVPPGESEPLTVFFDPKDRHGVQHRPVYVSWNSADGSQLRLMLTGAIVAGIEVEPSCAFFSNVPLCGALERVVRIYDPAGSRLFRITGFTCADTRFTARIDTVVAGRDYRLVVGCAGPREPGEIKTSVTVQTDHPDYAVLRVPIYLTTQEPIV